MKGVCREIWETGWRGQVEDIAAKKGWEMTVRAAVRLTRPPWETVGKLLTKLLEEGDIEAREGG